MKNLLKKIDITLEAIPMVITDLEGEPLSEDENQQPTIYLYGMDSDQFKKALRVIEREDDDRDEKLLAHCIKDWKNIYDDNGMEVHYSEEKALQLIKDYPIVKTQADRFIAERANYLKK